MYNLPIDKNPDHERRFPMSTLDATISMLEAMPEDARIKVMEFTQKLFTSRKPANPFVPVSQEQILSDLAESRQQISDSKGLDMEDILKRMGKQHGFIWRNHLTKSIVSAEKARIPHHPFHAAPLSHALPDKRHNRLCGCHIPSAPGL
jgi:ABC-type antimicrobial peptide transport system ATPase subunit